jgi:chromosome segregation ATPase
MEFSHEGGKLRRHGIGMKFSDYLNAEPSPRKVTQTFNVRDENRESILEQQLAQVSSELKSFEDQTNELMSLRQSTTTLNSERNDLSKELSNTKAKVAELSSQLDKEVRLKGLIRSLESQVRNHEQHQQEATEEANINAVKLAKQETELLKMAADKMLLETYQQELNIKVSFAEQKKEEITGELNSLKNKFNDIDTSAKEVMNKYIESQKEVSLSIDQKKILRNKIEKLESELVYNRTLSFSLNENMKAVQEFYEASQNNLSFSKTEASKLDETVTGLVKTLTNLEEENNYLIVQQHVLETALAKPTYVSQSVIERQEGFKIPFASSALNMRKNHLGTGVPTLLRFKRKELTNDNTQ